MDRTLAEMAAIDFSKIDLKAKYNEFNRRYFGGTLPGDVPLRFSAQLKAATGVTKAGLRWKPGVTPPPRRMLAVMAVTTDMVDIVNPSITMSTKLRYEEELFDAFFLHEMVHLWLMYNGRPYEQHGTYFRTKAAEVGRAAGVSIPVTHMLTGTEEINSVDKVVGLVMVEPNTANPDPYVTMFRVKDTAAWVEKAKSYARMLRRTVRVYHHRTKAHAVLSYRSPKARGFTMNRVTANLAKELDMTGAKLIAEFPFVQEGDWGKPGAKLTEDKGAMEAAAQEVYGILKARFPHVTRPIYNRTFMRYEMQVDHHTYRDVHDLLEFRLSKTGFKVVARGTQEGDVVWQDQPGFAGESFRVALWGQVGGPPFDVDVSYVAGLGEALPPVNPGAPMRPFGTNNPFTRQRELVNLLRALIDGRADPHRDLRGALELAGRDPETLAAIRAGDYQHALDVVLGESKMSVSESSGAPKLSAIANKVVDRLRAMRLEGFEPYWRGNSQGTAYMDAHGVDAAFYKEAQAIVKRAGAVMVSQKTTKGLLSSKWVIKGTTEGALFVKFGSEYVPAVPAVGLFSMVLSDRSPVTEGEDWGVPGAGLVEAMRPQPPAGTDLWIDTTDRWSQYAVKFIDRNTFEVHDIIGNNRAGSRLGTYKVAELPTGGEWKPDFLRGMPRSIAASEVKAIRDRVLVQYGYEPPGKMGHMTIPNAGSHRQAPKEIRQSLGDKKWYLVSGEGVWGVTGYDTSSEALQAAAKVKRINGSGMYENTGDWGPPGSALV